MSNLTDLFDRPLSVAADIGIAIAVGAVVYTLAGLVPLFPEAVRVGAGGALAGLAFQRARSNNPINLKG